MMTPSNLFIALLLLLAAPLASAEVGPQLCGTLQNHVGPLDYRISRGDELKLVETAHFTTQVEAALRGERGYLGQDLDYTLRAFPNHHRALISLQRYKARLQYLGKQDQLPRPLECYYERAIRWKPDDVMARMLYAQFLFEEKRPNEATAHLRIAEAQAADNPLTHYNIGLIYFDGKNYERARIQAKRAMELGLGRTTLKDQLAALGQWDMTSANAAAPAKEASR